MNTTTFESAKPGDKVWFITTRKWGSIAEVNHDLPCPIEVHFDGCVLITFTLDGKEYTDQPVQTLFWDEIPIIAPTKPLPTLEVDAKVIVWDDPQGKVNGHFSHFDEDGRICIFHRGRTSFTGKGATTPWRNWELAE